MKILFCPGPKLDLRSPGGQKVYLSTLCLILIIFTSGIASAKITAGDCSGETIYMGATCTTANRFSSSEQHPNATIKVEDVDTHIEPYIARIKISAFWDTYGTYGYDEFNLQAGNTYRYTNPGDENDYIEFTIELIGGSWPCETCYVQFENIDTQETFYVSASGNDGNSGIDESHKWATSRHAWLNVGPGMDVRISGSTDGGDLARSSDNLAGYSNAYINFIGIDFPITSLIQLQEVHFINITGFNITRNDGHSAVQIVAFDSDINIKGNKIYSPANALDINGVENYGATNISNLDYSDNYVISPMAVNINDVIYASGNYIHNNTFIVNFQGYISNTTGFYANKDSDGNYWTPYNGIDADNDSIGDTPFNIIDVSDNYPKMDREAGYVKDQNGTILIGAVVSQSGATYRNTTSNSSGHYALSTVGRNTITLTASYEGRSGQITATYNSQNANITIDLTSEHETEITFSNTTDYNSTITSKANNETFYGNVWIQDYNISKIYYLYVLYPNGDLRSTQDLSGVDFGGTPAFFQGQFKIYPDEDYGNYSFWLADVLNETMLYQTSILIFNGSNPNQTSYNPNCTHNCSIPPPGTFCNPFCINPYYESASMYFSSDLIGLTPITSAYFNNTVYLHINHPNGDYTNNSYIISFLKPDDSIFYNMTTLTEYGYASWVTPCCFAGTWTVNFIRKNISDNLTLILNSTSLYLSQNPGPPVINLSVLSGYVRENVSLSPIYAATVTAGSYSANTSASGYYIIPDMLDGNYTVTASKTGYTSSSASISIHNGSINNMNFFLSCIGTCPTPTPTGSSPTPTPTSTAGIPPGSTTETDLGNIFWAFFFIATVLYGIAFFQTLGDKE